MCVCSVCEPEWDITGECNREQQTDEVGDRGEMEKEKGIKQTDEDGERKIEIDR